MTGTNLSPLPPPEPVDLWDDEGVTNPDAPHLVLVVDDSAMQRTMLRKALQKWGYDVIEAESAREGLWLCQKHDVTMIISDWVMPGMNGPEFCHAFRQISRQGYGYFILLTSKAESREVAEGLNSGADDFLTKPFVFGELKARLRAGERIVEMHAQLMQKNKVVNEAFTTIKSLYDNLQSDLKEARRLQQSLVRQTSIDYERGHAAFILEPSGHVGGDLVGQFQVSDSVIGLYSLDVSGHGVASALMTARLAGYLSGFSPTQNIALVDDGNGGFTARDPAETVGLLNDTLLREMETDHYFTIALAIVDLHTGLVRCTQAGHPHPMIIRKDGSFEIAGAGGMPVGLLQDATFTSFDINLRPGDQFLLYSDGLTEAVDTKGVALDDDGLKRILGELSSVRGRTLLESIMTKLSDFCQCTEYEDDVSALVFEYKTAL